MPIQTLNHYQLYYSLSGSPQNPPLLLLHGFMGSGEDFSEVLESLSRKFYCITLDLPGHGQTQVLGGNQFHKMPEVSQGIVELLKELQTAPCFLLGYSMGGRLALYLALEFPQYFPKVILESGSPGLATEIEREERRQKDELLAKQLETNDLQLFVQGWYHQPLFHSLKKHHKFNHVLQSRLQNNPLELAKSLRYMGPGVQPSLWEKLPENQVDLLLLAGQSDGKFIKIHQEMCQIAPRTQWQIIPHSGHNIHLENVPAWLTAIQEFLSSESTVNLS